MKKFLSCLLMLLVTAGSLAGCGSSTGASSAAAGTSGSSATATGNSEITAAASWPGNKTVTVVCPFGAGGDTDFNARLIAQKLGQKLGGKFIVVNTTGNTGGVGAQSVLNAHPDGYTMLFSHTCLITDQLAGLTDFGFEDFDMCCIAASRELGTYYMRKDNHYGITDMKSLIAYTKQHPGDLTMASNVGGTSQVCALLMNQAGVDCTLVDMGDQSSCLAALLGKQVDITTCPYISAKEYVDNGTFICIGYIKDQVNPLLDSSKYPCLVNEGIKDPVDMFYCIAFPKGTDAGIISLVSKTTGDIIQNDKDYQSSIAKAYVESPCFYDTQDAIKLFTNAKNVMLPFKDQLSQGNSKSK